MFGPSAPQPFDPGCLRHAADLRRRGVEPTREAMHQVRHGVWVEESTWAALTPEQRHAAFVHATALCMDAPATFSRSSAAAIWGLPRIEPWPTRVHTHVEGGRRRGSVFVRPHLGPATEAVSRDGILVTSAARTVVDLARTETLHTAVAAADHALRHTLCSHEDLRAEVDVLPRGAHGRTAARLVLDLADPGAMSPGESLSRTQMFLLDLPRPLLQVEHADECGLIGVVDFDWPGVVGEFDGKVKYRIAPGASAEEAGEVLWREKQREDRLRRRVRVARWTWAVAKEPRALAKVLAEVGIRATARNTWFDLAPAKRAS